MLPILKKSFISLTKWYQGVVTLSFYKKPSGLLSCAGMFRNLCGSPYTFTPWQKTKRPWRGLIGVSYTFGEGPVDIMGNLSSAKLREVVRAQAQAQARPRLELQKELAKVSVGVVAMVKDGIITILNLSGVKAGEIVWIQSQKKFRTNSSLKWEPYLRGLVLNLNENNSQGLLLGNERLVCAGAVVFRSKQVFKLQCGLRSFGRVLDGLGNNRLGSVESTVIESRSNVEQKATGIIDREPVRIPLRTGLKAIDSLVPIGRGQRELIIGDRQTGKTSVALDALLNHTVINSQNRFRVSGSSLRHLRKITWFVYNGIGQKQSTVNQVKQILAKEDALWYSALVSATASEPAPLQFLSPYTACTLGEFIRDIVGSDCVIVYDDLSKHAVAYRQMSLLLRRPPGREAFPGDVFYVHSRLLERAGALTKTAKQIRGTLTAFPIIETQAGDVSAYIPTNVISITDGQIFLETELYYRGIRPAVNVGLSVSRVGSAAQPGLMKRVAGSLKMELAQYREIEGFSKLGASLDEHTQNILNRGENLIEILKQNVHNPLTMIEEVLSIFLGMGYSGAWLENLKRLKHYKCFPFSLYSRRRLLSAAWCDWFRRLSSNFTVSSINPLLSMFLHFNANNGVIEVNMGNRAENLILLILQKYSLSFFDDVMLSFLNEFSLFNFNPFCLNSWCNTNLYLYNLKFPTRPHDTIDSRLISAKKKSKSIVDVFVLSCKALMVRILTNPYNKLIVNVSLGVVEPGTKQWKALAKFNVGELYVSGCQTRTGQVRTLFAHFLSNLVNRYIVLS